MAASLFTTRFSWSNHLLAILLIGAPLSAAMYYGFPVFDDVYYAAGVKEHGPAAMVAAHPDRPVYGRLLQFAAARFGSSVLPLAGFNLFLWAILALEAAWLWRSVFPAHQQYSLLVCCLVLAPIVVRIQVSTVTVFIPCLIPTILSYAALILILRYYDGQTRMPASIYVVGCALAALGVLVSEYGVSTAAVGATVAAGYRCPAGVELGRVRRWSPIVALLLCVLVAYGVFLGTSDSTARGSVSPKNAFREVVNLPKAGVKLIGNFVQAVAGPYGAAFGRVRPDWDSKSTIAAFVYGILVGLVLWRMTRARTVSIPRESSIPRVPDFILPAAVLAGLAPIVFMGRYVTQEIFASRFLLPVLPVAVMVTIWFSLRIVRPGYSSLVIAFFGFLAGSATVEAAFSVGKAQGINESAGAALLPYVRNTTGLVVAVMRRGAYRLVVDDVTTKWPAEQSRRIWVVDPSEAIALFGRSTACRDHPTIKTVYRTIERSGPVDELLFVDADNPSNIYIERYCHAPLKLAAPELRGGVRSR